MKPVGLIDGKLRPCPNSPNCVCSQDSDPGHAIEPWPLTGDAEATRIRLLGALETLPRLGIVSAEPGSPYLHATDTSAIFRWVDDIEFLIDEEAGCVHVRSASRTGYSDLGVNKRRVAKLRAAYEASSRP